MNAQRSAIIAEKQERAALWVGPSFVAAQSESDRHKKTRLWGGFFCYVCVASSQAHYAGCFTQKQKDLRQR
jgi:hypothetical protein